MDDDTCCGDSVEGSGEFKGPCGAKGDAWLTAGETKPCGPQIPLFLTLPSGLKTVPRPLI